MTIKVNAEDAGFQRTWTRIAVLSAVLLIYSLAWVVLLFRVF